MRLAEELIRLSNEDLAKRMHQQFADCEQVQRRVLSEILEQAKDTEIGQKYHFSEINGVEDFTRRVPLSSWDDYEAYTERMKNGEGNILFNGQAVFFTLSSGTTSSRCKYIPDSEMSVVMRKLIGRMRQIQYFMAEPTLLGGRIMPLVSMSETETTSAGIRCGFASGLTFSQSEAKDMIAFPMSVFGIQDSMERDYQMMVAAISHRNVYVLAGNNASRMTALARMAQERRDDIIRDIAAKDPVRAEELKALETFTPATYWPDLKLGLFWLSASVGKTVEELLPYLPKTIKLMDVGYGSSEAKFNIPLKPGESSGALSTATAFYEFIPEGGGEPVMAHQTEVGKNYELVVTTWGGLYRYEMKDVVRDTGFVGNTPMIEYQYKSIEVLNMVDEKIPAAVLNDLIRQFFAEKGISIRQLQVYQNESEKRYDIYIEPVEGHLPIGAQTNQDIDHLLAHHFTGFNLFRNEMRVMNQPQVIEMPQGWQQSLYAKAAKKAGMTSGQMKLTLIAKEQQKV